MRAASNGHLAVVQALLEAGADIDLQNTVSEREIVASGMFIVGPFFSVSSCLCGFAAI